MRSVDFLFSPSGRLSPQPFFYGAAAVYLAGLTSQWLTVADAIVRGGLWAFAAIQIVLIWIWYTLHVKRLRDAGRATGIAGAVSVLYALSVILLLIVGAGFFSSSTSAGLDANASSALGLILLIMIFTTLTSAGAYGITWVIVAALAALAFVPLILAVAVTLWAATRPTAAAKT
jgi:uncharacterized membrane protein YhaH (DUF805 family)